MEVGEYQGWERLEDQHPRASYQFRAMGMSDACNINTFTPTSTDQNMINLPRLQSREEGGK